MAAIGPEEAFEQGKTIKDKKGNEFSIGQELGHGIVGKTYRGTVTKLGKGEHQFKVGQEVAIKSQPTSADPEEVAAKEREKEALKKEATLLSAPLVNDKKDYIVQPIFPGVDLRGVVYKLAGAKGQEEVTGKNNLTDPEKEVIAVGILREYDILQKLNPIFRALNLQVFSIYYRYATLLQYLFFPKPSKSTINFCVSSNSS